MRTSVILLLLLIPTILVAEEHIATDARSLGLGGAHIHKKQSLLDMEFTMSGGAFMGVHGRSHEALLSIQRKQESIKSSFDVGNFDPNNPTASAIKLADALELLDEWEDAKINKGDGIYGGYSAEFRVTTSTDLGIFTVGYGHHTLRSASIGLDKSSFNFDMKLFDLDGQSFTQAIEDIIRSIGQQLPMSQDAIDFANDLVAQGYSQEHAWMVASIVENTGFDLGNNGKSEEMLLSLLHNSLLGTGDSLELGASPVKGNKSFIQTRGITYQQLTIGYQFDMPMAEWLSVGVSANLYRARRVNDIVPLFNTYKMPNVEGEARYSFGLDSVITITPPNTGLNLFLSGSNIAPARFVWNDQVVMFSPQFSLGLNWSSESNQFPVLLAFEVDLNRIESYLLPGYHTQFVRGGIEFGPKWEDISFQVRFGFNHNSGDSKEPLVLTTGLGLQLWYFKLDIGAQSSTTQFRGSKEAFGYNLTSKIGLSASLSCNIKF